MTIAFPWLGHPLYFGMKCPKINSQFPSLFSCVGTNVNLHEAMYQKYKKTLGKYALCWDSSV